MISVPMHVIIVILYYIKLHRVNMYNHLLFTGSHACLRIRSMTSVFLVNNTETHDISYIL